MARKSKYETNVLPNLNRIPAWRKQGLTEKQVAQKLGVAYSTFRVYRENNPALAAALKKGREELVEELEASLYKRAMGYEYEETEKTVEIVGGEQRTRAKTITRTMAPDVGALCFALKNIAPDKWKDKIDHSGEFDVDLRIEVDYGNDKG